MHVSNVPATFTQVLKSALVWNSLSHCNLSFVKVYKISHFPLKPAQAAWVLTILPAKIVCLIIFLFIKIMYELCMTNYGESYMSKANKGVNINIYNVLNKNNFRSLFVILESNANADWLCKDLQFKRRVELINYPQIVTYHPDPP